MGPKVVGGAGHEREEGVKVRVEHLGLPLGPAAQLLAAPRQVRPERPAGQKPAAAGAQHLQHAKLRVQVLFHHDGIKSRECAPHGPQEREAGGRDVGERGGRCSSNAAGV